MIQMLKDYRTMLVIRLFEEKVEDLFTRGMIRGTAHAAVGQEAVAVGVCGALRKIDYVTSTHRGHGHFIARGGKPRRIMAELFGKRTGYSRGRGGSQFMADFRLGFIGANGITGGSLPVAVGVALSVKQRRTGGIVVSFFGDGASNQGTFHESLNLAAIWKLPIVFVCENNRYAMSMPVTEAVPIADIAARAASYGLPGEVVDGNDLMMVRKAFTAAGERARRMGIPTLLECKTYRFCGHSRGDRRIYRSAEEEAVYRRLDPIPRFRKTLMAAGLLTRPVDSRLRREARDTVRDAVRFAHRSKDPDPGTLTEGLLA